MGCLIICALSTVLDLFIRVAGRTSEQLYATIGGNEVAVFISCCRVIVEAKRKNSAGLILVSRFIALTVEHCKVGQGRASLHERKSEIGQRKRESSKEYALRVAQRVFVRDLGIVPNPLNTLRHKPAMFGAFIWFKEREESSIDYI